MAEGTNERKNEQTKTKMELSWHATISMGPVGWMRPPILAK